MCIYLPLLNSAADNRTAYTCWYSLLATKPSRNIVLSLFSKSTTEERGPVLPLQCQTIYCLELLSSELTLLLKGQLRKVWRFSP